MRYKIIGALAVLVAAFGLSAIGFADPVTGFFEKNAMPKFESFPQLASLDMRKTQRQPLNMSPRVKGPFNLQFGIQSAEPEKILLAARCGSSNYYCNETGATYCCGNSTDGFYCAKDVNGCTK